MDELKDERSSCYNSLTSGQKVASDNPVKHANVSALLLRDRDTYVSRTLDFPAD